MSGNKWTPGPWRTNKYDSVGAGAFGVTPIVAAEIEKAADMDLISAAPELAEALEALVDFPSDFFDRTDSERVQITVTGWHLKKARAALAKARGEG